MRDGEIVLLTPSVSSDDEEDDDASEEEADTGEEVVSTADADDDDGGVVEDDEDNDEEEEAEDPRLLVTIVDEAIALVEAPTDPRYRPGMRAYVFGVRSSSEGTAEAWLARVEDSVYAQRLDAWHMEARIRALGLSPMSAMAGWRTTMPGRALDQLLLRCCCVRVRPLNIIADDGARSCVLRALGAHLARLYNHIVGETDTLPLAPSAMAVLMEARAAWLLVAGFDEADANDDDEPQPRIISRMHSHAERYLTHAVLPRLHALRPLFFAWMVPRYDRVSKAALREEAQLHAQRTLSELLPQPEIFWDSFQSDLRSMATPTPAQAAFVQEWLAVFAQHLACAIDALEEEAPTARAVTALMWVLSAARALPHVIDMSDADD
jgi:hypothetical protein